MSALRLLIRPTIFTVGVCGTCFCGAAIVQYENKKPQFRIVQDWTLVKKQRTYIESKYLNLRRQVNDWKNRLTVGHKIAYSTIFINLAVLGAWKVNRLKPVMTKFFLSHISTTKIPLSPMILSCFSHSMPLHFAFNMWALYSFAPFATGLLGPEQLIGLFLSAGVVSSWSSITFRLLSNRTIPSLGASGALLGVIAYICVARQDTNLLLFFIPMTAGTAIKAIMAFDTVGLLAGWRIMDHAAHLGGCTFGAWYALYGEKLFYDHRRSVVQEWIRFKKRFD